MIEFPSNTLQSIKQLKKIWKICFGDDESCIDLFFTKMFSQEQTLVYYSDNVAAAMLFLLPARLKIGNITYAAQYIYGACTLPEYRNNGIMTKLIEEAKRVGCKRKLAATVLVPSEKSLFDYYENRGFIPFFSKKTTMISRDILQEYSTKLMVYSTTYSARRAKNRRDYFMESQNGIIWDENHLDYAFKENLLTGGTNFFSQYGYAIIYANDDLVEVTEMTFHVENIGVLFNYLLNKFNVDKFKFHLSPEYRFLSGIECERMTNGMICSNLSDIKFDSNYDINKMYLGLGLE